MVASAAEIVASSVSNVCVPSLYEVFQAVPEPRKARGVRYPLAGLLTQATTALLCGYPTLQAIAAFGRRRRHLGRWLGYRSRAMPCLGVFHYLFKGLDPELFGDAISLWW